MTDDIATRLLAAIDTAEQAAQADLVIGVALHARRQRAKADLRRCAADRKIIELHEPMSGFSGQQCTLCVGCWATEEGEDWPCENLRLLAEGYGITEETT